MENKSVKQTVIETIIQLAKEQNKSITVIKDDDSLVDSLGLTSLEVATLVSLLESKLDVDPFTSGTAITDIRTVENLSDAYEKALKKVD